MPAWRPTPIALPPSAPISQRMSSSSSSVELVFRLSPIAIALRSSLAPSRRAAPAGVVARALELGAARALALERGAQRGLLAPDLALQARKGG